MQTKDPREQHGVFSVTEDTFLFNPERELLALRHFTGRWLLVGGHVNVGEDWRSALKREIAEETGVVDSELGKILAVDCWTNAEGPHYGVFFLARTTSRDIVLSEEHTDYRWLRSREEVEELDWWCPPLRERAVAAWEEVHGKG